MIVDIDRPNWSLLRRVDLIGIGLVAGFLGSLEFVLDEGPRDDWFESERIVWFAALSAVSAALLFWRELTIDEPVIELKAFRNRNFAVGCLLTFVLGMRLYGQSSILPQVLSRVRGYNSLQIGQVIWVTGAAMFVTAPIAGRLSSAVDPRKILAVGFPLVALGLWLTSHMTTEVGFDQLLLAQVLRGVGLVLCIVTITGVALGTLPPEEVAGGSDLFNLFRNMGGAVGLAMINTQWDGRYDRPYWWLAENLSNTDEIVRDRLADIAAALSADGVPTADPDQMALRQLSRQVAQQASIMTWDDVFWLIAVAFLIATPLVLLFARPRDEEIAVH